ncbi:Calcium-binding ef-hand family protein [Thalictrum thalictroides]|uniref:Calcium-binding ef-hand family protein n=1 Tax=Thalictrum thalictroides TaxID=46969 RepID=A0A7J6WQ21_THATH|nr:Calcium-binding ef-hand family protein [Thalictrum thalictroides]
MSSGMENKQTSQTEFPDVVSDDLLGMATGLKRERDPIVILRMDGEDLLEFINSARFEPELISIFSQLDMAEGSILDHITKTLQQLTVDHGMPPLSDSWVVSNIVEPSLQCVVKHDGEYPITQEMLFEQFKKVAERLAQLLNEQPVIVAHSEQTFDGSGIRRLLSNSFEINKILEGTLRDLPKDQNGKVSKEYVPVALGSVGRSAGLPPVGVVDQMDNMVEEAIQIKIHETDEGKMIEGEILKKLVMDILENIMLQLEGNPISISSNSVVHEPLSSPST